MAHTQSSKWSLQIFIDPWYGSERYVEFDPSWVVDAEDRMQKLIFRPAEPVTFLRFRNGERHLVFGHHSEAINTARNKSQSETHSETDTINE